MAQKRKDHVFSVRLSPEEAARLQRQIEVEGYSSVSGLLRRLIGPIVGVAVEPNRETLQTLLERIQKLEALVDKSPANKAGD